MLVLYSETVYYFKILCINYKQTSYFCFFKSLMLKKFKRPLVAKINEALRSDLHQGDGGHGFDFL